MEIVKLLSEASFFQGISNSSIKDLAAICIPKSLSRGEILFLEGQEGHSFFLLASGSVQLYKTAADGREIVIKLIQPGEIFAEVVLFEEKCYPVSAISLSGSQVLRLSRVQIQCLLARESFRNDFISMLMNKQRYLANRILELSVHDVEERFFSFLRRQYGEQEEYRITLSKKDIAGAIGTIPETFSRLLLRLKKAGEINWAGGVLKLRPGFWEDRKTPG